VGAGEWGLLVAMPASSFCFFFNVELQRLTFELSNAAMVIVQRLKPTAAPYPVMSLDGTSVVGV
jgi:hypothetical protein